VRIVLCDYCGKPARLVNSSIEPRKYAEVLVKFPFSRSPAIGQFTIYYHLLCGISRYSITFFK